MEASSILNELSTHDPKALLALYLWLSGEDEASIINKLDLNVVEMSSRLEKHNIHVDFINGEVKVSNVILKRFENCLDNLLNSKCLKNIINYLTNNIKSRISSSELKYLVYAMNYLEEFGKIDLHGLSNYVITCEKTYYFNVEYDILRTLTRYLIFKFNSREMIFEEYPWSRELLRNLVGNYRDIVERKEYYLHIFNRVLRKFKEKGIIILSALHSIYRGYADHFIMFHNLNAEKVVESIGDIDCVVYKSLVNPVAMKLLDKYLLARVLLIHDQVSKVLSSNNVKIEGLEFRYDFILSNAKINNHEFKIVAPIPYYLAPFFWSIGEEALYIIHNIPFSISIYLSRYSSYLENSIVMFVSNSGEVELHYTATSDALHKVYEILKSNVSKISTEVSII